MENHQDKSIKSLEVITKISGKITCSDILSVIFNVIFWLFLILIIINYTKGLGIKLNVVILLLILGVISYIIYIYQKFHTTTFTYISAKSDKKIKEKIGEFFQAKPSLFLKIQLFHYEKKYFKGSYTDSIVYTHNYKSKFNYEFWRDISGNIKLDIKKSFYKYYVILKVNQELIFIDSDTLGDYNKFEECFIQGNQDKDSYYKFSRYIEIEGMKDINIINLNEKEPPFVRYCWYIIFSFLSLAILYKLYIWIISVDQTITIRKIISNRNDLINNPIYNKYNPQVKFFDEVKSYGKNDAQRELPINNDISSENIVDHNNARRELPLNNNINNENLNQLNGNDVKIEIKKNNSLSTKYNSNIPEQE